MDGLGGAGALVGRGGGLLWGLWVVAGCSGDPGVGTEGDTDWDAPRCSFAGPCRPVLTVGEQLPVDADLDARDPGAAMEHAAIPRASFSAQSIPESAWDSTYLRDPNSSHNVLIPTPTTPGEYVVRFSVVLPDDQGRWACSRRPSWDSGTGVGIEYCPPSPDDWPEASVTDSLYLVIVPP